MNYINYRRLLFNLMFHTKNMDKTLEEAFRELIKKRKWYVNSLRSPVQAIYDKTAFLKGKKIPEERMREYLSAAGWKCTQEEKWGKNLF